MKKHNFTTKEGYAKHVFKQANILLDKCRIYGNAEDRKGLMQNIENSIEAKSELFEIFKNSPYHNGKGQLIIPMEIERPIDEDIILDFAYYIEQIAKDCFLYKEAEIDGYTYKQAEYEREIYNKYINAVNYMSLRDDEVIIKGKPFSEYRDKYNSIDELMDRFHSECYHVSSRMYCTMENKKLYDKAVIIANTVRNCVGKTLENAEDIAKLAEAFPRCQCREGVKVTKVILKCLKEIGLHQFAMENEQETFNRKYSYWCDAISPMKIKKWSILSINFVDFLSMSNGSSWTSCLNTDKDGYFTNGDYCEGFNSRRTLDYALDPSTMVFYTIDENYDADGDGDDWELQPKNTRQLFHFGNNKLIQARLYPQDRASRRNIYTQYRENVEFLLANAMGEANLWSAPERGTISTSAGIFKTPYRYSDSGSYIDFSENACHGGGERDFQSEVNYVRFRGSTNLSDNTEPMMIGSTQARCIMCGDSMHEDYTDSISCCREKYIE